MVQQVTVSQHLLNWLLEEDEPSARYHTLVELLGKDEDETQAEEARQLIGKKGWAASILERQKDGTYWENKESCYVPKFSSCAWELIVLGDLGVSGEDLRVRQSVDHFFELHNVEEGGFSLRAKGSQRFGPHICMTGNLVRTLARFGYAGDDRVVKAMDWLVSEQLEDGGWNCFTEDGGKHGSFKATIEPLWALSEMTRLNSKPSWAEAAKKGAEFLLRHRLYKSDVDDSVILLEFLTLHYPLHYHYDFLHGLRVLTSLGIAKDERMDDAVRLLLQKQFADEKWVLEGVFRGWRHSHPIHGGNTVSRPEEREIITQGWGGGNTLQIEAAGEPSKWITLQALLVLKRAGLLNLPSSESEPKAKSRRRTG